jgi:cytoskeletal protein CcmA (bactofilin family)
MKSWREVRVVLLGVILLAMSGPVLARPSGIDVVGAKDVVAGDKFATGQIITNEGTIKGDLVFAGQNISSTGTVEGDVIGAGQDISLSGNVLGNVRVAGATLHLTGQTGKNATLFGGAVSLAQSSVVKGSVTAFGGSVALDGKITGRTVVYAGNVVLAGEFFGDVDINDSGARGSRFHGFGMGRSPFRDRHSKTKLTVLPGTIIHGALRFRGSSADIQKGAQVPDFRWTKPGTAAPANHWPGVYWYAWKLVRLLFTTAVYFLMGLLLLKLFPAFFNRAAELAVQKPWNAIGRGVIGLLSGIAVAIGCVILIALSLIMSPAFGIVSAMAAVAFYALLFFLAAVPAALWLGGLMCRERPPAYRLAAGVVVINGGLFILAMLGRVPAVGPIFPAIAFIVRFAVVLLGGGALLHALWESCVAAKKSDRIGTAI